MVNRLAWAVVVAVAAPALCFADIGALNPRPNLDLPRSSASLAVDVSAVPDRYDIPEQSGIKPVTVEQWRATLKAGFRNGPARFFNPPAGTADYTLKLVKATLDYLPAAVYERSGGAAAVRARVVYMAQLLDRQGQIAARMKGEAVSTSLWSTFGGDESTATEAVALMFEEITDMHLRALTGGGAAPLPPPPPPPASASSELPPPPPPPVMEPGVPPPAPVYGCNPPCDVGQRCTTRGECVGDVETPEGERPAPPGQHYELRRKKGLLITGLALLGGGWAVTSLAVIYGATLTNYSGYTYLALIPVIGPLTSAFAHSSAGRVTDPFVVLFALVSTAVQVTGLALGIVGLIVRRPTLVDDEAARAQPESGFRWAFAPIGPNLTPGATFAFGFGP